MKPSLLLNHGILGLNARNLLYIKPFNPRKAVALADDKLRTKAFLAARGIPAAKIYARFETREQVRAFDFGQLPDECVLKPNAGFGGEGILILKGRAKNGDFLVQGKTPLPKSELMDHIEDILDGKYSISGRRDTAFFEQILYPHDCFARFRPAGLPDIRVIVFNLVPVMAMLRVPTAESEGKANVHLGGIGMGIDIATGRTTHAAQYNHIIKELPHGGAIAGMEIPFWEEILLVCSKIQYLTNIGYLACDITIDGDMGPALLEVNARAGLMVQVANLAPLKSRLERVQGLKVTTPEKGVQIGRDLFGTTQKREETDKKINEKKLLGTRENIKISGTGTTIEIPCVLAPGEPHSIFAPELIAKLEEQDLVERDEGAEFYKVKFTLGGKKIQTAVASGFIRHPEVQAVIGKRDLTDFLIDPTKSPDAAPKKSVVKADLRAVDNLYASLDRDLLMIKYLKPLNLEEERMRLRRDRRYSPLFLYRELEVDIDEAKKRLKNPILDPSPLGILLEKKRIELLQRIDLLATRGHTEKFTKASIALFGTTTKMLMMDADRMLAERIACDLPPPERDLLSATETKDRFDEVLERYGLHDWQVSIRPRLVADCTVGGRHIYLREGARFAPDHIESLIKHEIETHVLTAENGEHQPYSLLRRGCAGYLDTQEGLAIFNQNRVLGPFNDRRYNPPRNLLALDFALTHSFADTREYLEEELGYDASKALTQAIAMKRGLADTSEHGAFTKSVVYFRGVTAVESFVKNGGDLKRLYIGKVALEDLGLIEQVEGLEEPLLLPDFLRVNSEENP